MGSTNLLKKTLIYSIGNLGSKILSFILIPLYSFYLKKDEMGVYDIIITTISLLVPIVTIQISEAVYRWLIEIENNKEEKSRAISNSLTILLIISFVYSLIFIAIFLIFDIEYKWYFLILLFTASFLPYFQQVARGIGQIKLYSVVGLINTGLVVCFNCVLLILFKFGVEGILISSILANLISIFIFIWKAKLNNYFFISISDWTSICKMIKYSWPLVPNSISWWMINAADKYIILYFLGESANGTYAVSSRFPALITVLNSIFMLSWQDFALSKETDGNQDYMSTIFKKYYIFEFTVVLILIACSRIMVKYLLSDSYFDSWSYMPLLYIGAAFSSFSAFLGIPFLKSKKTTIIFSTSIIGGLVNLLISVMLIKFIGLYSSVIGTVVSFCVIFLIRLHYLNKITVIKINYYLFIGLFLISLIFFGLLLYNNTKIDYFLIFASLVFFIWCNNATFIKGLRSIRKRINV